MSCGPINIIWVTNLNFRSKQPHTMSTCQQTSVIRIMLLQQHYTNEGERDNLQCCTNLYITIFQSVSKTGLNLPKSRRKNDLAPLKGKMKAARFKTRSQYAANANKEKKSREIYATLKLRTS